MQILNPVNGNTINFSSVNAGYWYEGNLKCSSTTSAAISAVVIEREVTAQSSTKVTMLPSVLYAPTTLTSSAVAQPFFVVDVISRFVSFWNNSAAVICGSRWKPGVLDVHSTASVTTSASLKHGSYAPVVTCVDVYASPVIYFDGGIRLNDDLDCNVYP